MMLKSNQNRQPDDRETERRLQTWALLAAYRNFANLSQVGLEQADSLQEFATFIGPASRELASKATRLEDLLLQNSALMRKQSHHAD